MLLCACFQLNLLLWLAGTAVHWVQGLWHCCCRSYNKHKLHARLLLLRLMHAHCCCCCSTGKLEVVPTKLMGTKEDLSVAYSPGAQCSTLHMLH
jgi:hypothetical protein